MRVVGGRIDFRERDRRIVLRDRLQLVARDRSSIAISSDVTTRLTSSRTVGASLKLRDRALLDVAVFDPRDVAEYAGLSVRKSVAESGIASMSLARFDLDVDRDVVLRVGESIRPPGTLALFCCSA